MKKCIALITTIVIFVGLAACASHDEIADELIEYYNNQWIPIQVKKNNNMHESEDKIREIQERTEGYDEEEMESIITEEVIRQVNEQGLPAADRAIEEFKSVQPKHKKVDKLNNMKIEAEVFGRSVLEKLKDFYRGDISESEFKEEQDELNKKYDEVGGYLEKLIGKYNLEYDYEKGSIEGYYEIKREED